MRTSDSLNTGPGTSSSSSDRSQPEADAPPRPGDSRYAVRMPIDGDVDTVEEAVSELRKCDPSDLRRARRHHRRALKALENGLYGAINEETRNQLVGRLRSDLEALNQALHQGPLSGRESADDGPGAAAQGDAPDAAPSSGFGIGKLASMLW